MEQSSTRDIDELNARLDEWSESEALVAKLTSSLRHLEISLWNPGRATQLSVRCYTPLFFCGPLGWSRAGLKATKNTANNSFEEYELRDSVHNVLVRCTDIVASVEPAPHWHQEPDDRPR